MIIYPQGLLRGERLAACSDAARLHFPQLAALANGFGRMELNARLIVERAYAGFAQKPTREMLTSWFREYSDNHLLLVYKAEDGSLWGQWCGVPANALPRYQTTLDKQSPEPPPETVEAFNAAYAAKKRERAEASGDFLDISENFGNLPKASEISGTFPPVVVVVGGVVGVVGEEEKQIPSSPSAPNGKSSPAPAVVAIDERSRKGKRTAGSVKPYHPRFQRAYELYPKHEEKSESEPEYLAALQRLQQGERDKPPMSAEDAMGFLEDAARDYALKKKDVEKDKVRSMRRWLLNSTYLDFAPTPKTEYVIVDPDEWWEGGAAHAV